jgi:uncharacterized protein (DUF1015 family)
MPQVAGFRGALAQPPNLQARDSSRAVYRYHQTFSGPGRSFTRKNLVMAVRLSPWDEGIVRPHETTPPAARDAALAKIRAANGHLEPFVAGFRDPPGEVERLLRKYEGGTPQLDVTTPDGTQHRVWRIQDSELLGKLRHYFAPKKLHVLEGHDRYEAMLAYQAELAAKTSLAMYSSANYGLAVLINLEEPALATAPRHRIVKGSAAKRDDVLAAARTQFIVEKLPGAAADVAKLQASLADTVAHQPAFVAVFPGDPDAWKLTLSPEVSPFDEGVASHRALQKYDPIVVDNLFVARAFPGAQIATDTDAKRALATAGASAVLITRPLTIEQIIHVDELGQMLPPGSTALYPAVANLIGMAIDPDEDLV